MTDGEEEEEEEEEEAVLRSLGHFFQRTSRLLGNA